MAKAVAAADAAEDDVEIKVDAVDKMRSTSKTIKANSFTHHQIPTSSTITKNTTIHMEQISPTVTTLVHADALDPIINGQPRDTMQWAEQLKQATRSTCLVVVPLIPVLDAHLLAIPRATISSGEMMAANMECDGSGQTIVVDM